MRLLVAAAAVLLTGCHASYASSIHVALSDVAVRDLTGKWITTWDGQARILFLKQEGAAVSGLYAAALGQPPSGGTLEGRLVGNELKGNWDESPGRAGAFRFVFRADGETFEGTWGNAARDDDGGIWGGRRDHGMPRI